MAGRAAIPHLQKRPKGLFSWRRRWPRNATRTGDATSGFGAFLCFSLRTDVPADAKALARRLTALSDPVFAAVTGKTMPLDRATAEVLLSDLVRFEIEAADRARAVAPFRPIEVAEAEAAREAALQATLRRAIFERDREVARAPLREVAARLGLELDETGPEWLSLAIEATRVLLDISEERARRDRGVFSGPAPVFRSVMRRLESDAVAAQPAAMTNAIPISPQAWFGAAATATHPGPAAAAADSPRASDRAHGDVPIEADDAIEVDDARAEWSPVPIATIPPAARAPTTGSAPGRTTPKGGHCTLNAGFLAYVEARCAGKDAKRVDEPANVTAGDSWSRQSGPNVQGTQRLMARFFGDRPLASVTGKDMSDFFTVLQRVPANHGKSPDEERDPRDLVASADAEEARRASRIRLEGTMSGMSEGNIEAAIAVARVRRVRVNTVYRHMQDTKRMFRYMVALGRIAFNPMDEVIWSKKTLDHLLALEEDEGRLPWEREHLNALFRSPIFQQPLDDIGDPLFWTPLFAVFHSLREEEALQLLTEDIREVDGILVFDLCKGPGKQFKTADSIRRIPVHKSLIALGLPELVRLRRQQGESRLFPHLVRNAKRGTFSANFTRTFGRYREQAKIYDPQRDFHALRTTFNVELIRNRVDAEIRKVLMGHRILDVNYVHYSGEGYSLEHLRDVVNMIDIDIGMIRKPFAELPAVARLTPTRHALRVVT